MKYVEKIEQDLTQHLEDRKNSCLRNILTILDISSMSSPEKSKIRSVILNEVNNLKTDFCKILTYIQENG